MKHLLILNMKSCYLYLLMLFIFSFFEFSPINIREPDYTSWVINYLLIIDLINIYFRYLLTNNLLNLLFLKDLLLNTFLILYYFYLFLII